MKKYSVAETEKKVKKIFTIICDTLELIVAVIVAIGVILAMLSLIPELGGLLKSDTGALTPFLEQVFTVVIGVEFLKMLCRPNSDNVFETIIFLVARHMIVNDTSPLEDLLSTVSIVLLCLVRRYLKETGRRAGRAGLLFCGFSIVPGMHLPAMRLPEREARRLATQKKMRCQDERAASGGTQRDYA